jgi:hypothetical protein
MPLHKWLKLSANSTQMLKNQYVNKLQVNIQGSGTLLAQIKKSWVGGRQKAKVSQPITFYLLPKELYICLKNELKI